MSGEFNELHQMLCLDRIVKQRQLRKFSWNYMYA